jgi:hypothetical protein
MKKLLFTITLATISTFVQAQGTIQLANNAGTRFTVNGVRPTVLAPSTYNFGVFVGMSESSLSVQPVGGLGTNTSTIGLIGGPSANAFQLPGYEPNTTVFIQIRGWESRFGGDWEAGRAGGLFGQTEIRPVLLGPATGPGTVVWSSTDLTKFQAINFVPEPSTIALAVLGLGSLLLFRRRK